MILFLTCLILQTSMNPLKVAMSGAERAKKFRARNPEKFKHSKLKSDVKILENKLSDETLANKIRVASKLRKQKSRATKKSSGNSSSAVSTNSPSHQVNSSQVPTSSSQVSTSSSSSTSPVTSPSSAILNIAQKSRQGAAGLKTRKKNLIDKNRGIENLKTENSLYRKQLDKIETENFDLQLQLVELKKELLKKDATIDALKEKVDNCDDWLKLAYPKMSEAGKKEFKVAVNHTIPDLRKGTVSRLRKSTGINFSNFLVVDNPEVSNLKKAIEEFAVTNSCVVPDMRKEKRNIRYYHNYLICLHAMFLQENPLTEVSYSSFCSYWPKKVIKPNIEDYAREL